MMLDNVWANVCVFVDPVAYLVIFCHTMVMAAVVRVWPVARIPTILHSGGLRWRLVVVDHWCAILIVWLYVAIVDVIDGPRATMRSATDRWILLVLPIRSVIQIVLPGKVARALIAISTHRRAIIVFDNFIVFVSVREVFVEDLTGKVHEVWIDASWAKPSAEVVLSLGALSTSEVVRVAMVERLAEREILWHSLGQAL